MVNPNVDLGPHARLTRDDQIEHESRSECRRSETFPGPYAFFFYSFDCNEPLHVRRDNSTSFGTWSWSTKIMIEAWHEHRGQR